MNIIKIVGKYIFEFFPLIVFLQLSGRQDSARMVNWLFAFEIAAIVSALHILFFITRKCIINRVALGINLYFLFAGIVSFFSFAPALTLLRSSREFGMLIPILLVGIVTTFLSPYGFVGYQSKGDGVYIYSIYLLVLASFASALSFFYMGNPLLAGVVPIFLIVIANRLLLHRLRNASHDVLF